MSMRHLQMVQEMTEAGAKYPIREILALPDNLELCEGYNPTDFGMPGGPPRMLGTQYPVIVDGVYTYIHILTHDKINAYAKLRA